MTLTQITQEDFAVGTLRGVAPDVQPGVGVYRALNGLFNDDGDIYRRGGSQRLGTNPDFAEPLTWMWTGTVAGFSVKLVATSTKIYTFTKNLIASEGLAPGVQIAVIRDTIYFPTGTPTPLMLTYSASTPVAGHWTVPAAVADRGRLHLATIAGRLIVAAGNRIAFSDPENAATFDPTDFHELPGGMSVVGLAAIQDTLLVFTDFGLWAITNMAYNLTDAAGNIQQTLSLITPELSLLGEAGLAPWSGRFVAPCVDRVYMVDAISQPVPISDSITPLYMKLLADGYKPTGAKVYRNTLLLPMMRFDSEGVAAQTLLACRLNRPVRGRYVYYPWSECSGHLAQHTMFDVGPDPRSFTSAAERPDARWLFGSGLDGRISDLRALFDPTTAVPAGADADGTVYPFEVETRDFPTGRGQPNHLKRVRLRYTLEGAATVAAHYLRSEDSPGAWVSLGSQALEPGTGRLAAWWLPLPSRARWVRVRFTFDTGAPVARLIYHHVDLSVRSATHAR